MLEYQVLSIRYDEFFSSFDSFISWYNFFISYYISKINLQNFVNFLDEIR